MSTDQGSKPLCYFESFQKNELNSCQGSALAEIRRRLCEAGVKRLRISSDRPGLAYQKRITRGLGKLGSLCSGFPEGIMD